ncbi:hypothetical protein V8B97DRAFT_2025516 [Scleroderma yunnanense]
MPNLTWNPHIAMVPDYTTECFILAFQPFNAIERQEWDTQEEQQHAQTEEQELVLHEERKKNCNKFLPFTDTQIFAALPVLSSPLTLHKLQKGEYCKLYFFMNKGLADTQAISHTVDNEALAITQNEHGLHTYIHTYCFYQATAWKRWHDTLGMLYSFDLKYLNSDLLNKIQSNLIHKAHTTVMIQAKEVNQWLIMVMNSQQRAGTTHLNTPTNYHTPSTSKHSALPSAEQAEPSHKHNNCTLHSAPVVECKADRTWDKKHKTFSKWLNRFLITKRTRQHLCSRWQHKDGCADKHTLSHLCSGCGSSSHGTQ